jgi:imidazolonepropionase-like amidohydrolase
MNKPLSLLAPVFLAVAAMGAKAGEHVDLLIRDTTVVDVLDGSLHAHRAIAVHGDRIAAIVDDADIGRFDADRTIDGVGTYAIPGLWDMHMHFGGGEALVEENENLLPLYVANGITGVRDCAGDLSPSVFAWRAATAAGTLIGPTIFTSGPKIEGYKSIWPGDQEVGTRQEVEQALDRLQGWHADFVKITDNTLSPELFLATLQAAEKRGMKTSAHISHALTLDEVADAGLDSIEHIDYAFKAGSPDEKAIGVAAQRKDITDAEAWTRWEAGFDPARARAVYARLAKHGMAITPTLNISRVTAYLDQDDHAHDDYLKYIGPGLRATYAWRVERAAKADAAAIELRHRRFERDASLLPMLQQSGMTILAGTDAGFLNSFDYPGIGLHDELGLLVRYGLTPLQALQAATINGARFLGHDDRFGTLAVGKSADVVLLRANPIEDIAATRKIEGVVLKGKAFDRGQLDAMLADVEARVAAENAARDAARNPPKNTP